MRWFCSFKTSRQLVSWCTGGVEGDDCHRCSDSVCLYVWGGGGGGGGGCGGIGQNTSKSLNKC